VRSRWLGTDSARGGGEGRRKDKQARRGERSTDAQVLAVLGANVRDTEAGSQTTLHIFCKISLAFSS